MGKTGKGKGNGGAEKSANISGRDNSLRKEGLGWGKTLCKERCKSRFRNLCSVNILVQMVLCCTGLPCALWDF